MIAVQGLWSADVFAERPSAGLAAVNTSLTAGTLVGPVLGGLVIGAAGYGPALGLAALATLATLLQPPPPTCHRENAIDGGETVTGRGAGELTAGRRGSR